MARMLVCYGTGEGQTETVAERVASVLEDRGHEVTAANVAEEGDALDVVAYDAVVVGASIHYGKHQSAVVEFVQENRTALADRPTAFFQLSLSSATEQGREQAAGYVEAFLEETDWHPDRIAQFGGALRFSEYGFLKRLMMKGIVSEQLPDVDTSADVEFTDWTEVEAFTRDVAAFVEGRLGEPAPAGS